MKTEKNENPVFYGIASSSKYPIEISQQKIYFKLMFINPNISPSKARSYLSDSFYFMHINFIIESMRKEIISWETEGHKNSDKLHIEMQLIEKIEHWIKEFSLPMPEEVCEMAKIGGLSETALYRGIYSLYLTGKLPSEKIIDFLDKYSNNISDRLIDNLLDKYNSNKPKRRTIFKNIFSKAAIY